MLHATMLKTIYDLAEVKPGAEDVYQSGAPMDLRNGYLLPEYSVQGKFVNSAVAIQPINVPCSLYGEGDIEGLWAAAKCVNDQWAAVRGVKGIGKKVEASTKGIISAFSAPR